MLLYIKSVSTKLVPPTTTTKTKFFDLVNNFYMEGRDLYKIEENCQFMYISGSVTASAGEILSL